MSRDKNWPRDDENRQEPEDVIRFQERPRSQPPRQRSSREDILRRLRQPSSSRQHNSRNPENDPTTTRPRQTRNFREEEEQERAYRPTSPSREPHTTRPIREDAYGEREPRSQRQRLPLDPRERDYLDERYTNKPRRREIDTEDERYADYDDYRRSSRRPDTRYSRTSAPLASPRKRRAGRSIWSTLLIGVLGGIIAIALVVGLGWFFLIHTLQVSFPGLGIGTSKFTSPQETVPLNITSSITQLQVTNNTGNITISDGNAQQTGGSLTYVKKTQASSSSNAASDFARIQVKVQPGNSPACPQASCVTVSVRVPANLPASIDMTIVLPAQTPTPQFVLNATTQTGNIAVQGFNGLLTLTVDTGSVDVKGGLLDAGSCLQDRFGNVSFAGTLQTGTAPAINPCQGNPITTPNSTQPWFSIKVGTGNIDASLNSVSANVILDAVIFNSGKITSDFPITIPSAAPPAYNGPLLPGTQPSAQLLLSTDTGNITLHKV